MGHLNGGPGAPAFVWVHPRHANWFWQPLSGWWGHVRPSSSRPTSPPPGITRYPCGTQPMISLSALQCGWMCSPPRKSLAAGGAAHQVAALTDLFIQLGKSCAGYGAWPLPREHAQRGLAGCLTRDEGAGVNGWAAAPTPYRGAIARGVIGDSQRRWWERPAQRHPCKLWLYAAVHRL